MIKSPQDIQVINLPNQNISISENENIQINLADDPWASFQAYEGEYSVIPSTEENITLATANKALNDDITVKKIPYAEVSNNSGGITATIGN